MSFKEELQAFQDTHPFSETNVDSIGVKYL